MTGKPRPFTARKTWPHVIQYRLDEGPHKKGLVLNAPPDMRAFPAPVVYDVAAGRERQVSGSAAYMLVIHDADEFWRLDRAGEFRRANVPAIDNRRAPGG